MLGLSGDLVTITVLRIPNRRITSFRVAVEAVAVSAMKCT